MNRLYAALSLLSAIIVIGGVPALADAPPEMWDLTPLYADGAAWQSERKSIEAALPELAALKGTLRDGASLKAAMDKIWAVRGRLRRLMVYAGLKGDEDTRIASNQAQQQMAQDLDSKLGEAVSFLAPEVLALGRKKVEGFIASTPGLSIDRYELETILRQGDHTLSPEGETLLAGASAPLSQPGEIYSLLANADIPWPSIEIGGQQVRLDQSAYVAHRADPDAAVRKRVFDAFFGELEAYERSFGAIYLANVKGTVFVAKAREYPNALSAALSQDNVPEAVYRTLVNETHNGLPALHRYFADSKKLLGLSELRYSDNYVPLAPEPKHYTLGDAEALTLEGVKPLGPDYAKDMKHGFDSAWMNALVQPGKQSGAYMNGAAYDVHPYVLLSFTGDYGSVSTVAHEWGHAMHSVLANRAQPVETANYPIFIAEIPSTTNEMLLADHVIATSTSKQERIFALCKALELLRTTFFRQAMFAEFEADSHDAVERGEALTGDGLSKTYLGILKRYMGDAEGIVKVDDLYAIEWAYIPHFYHDFYVYQYATSISAAAYFAEGIERGDTALRDRYFTMLKSGGSDDPYTIVKRAGVDLATPVPYQALVNRMNRLLDQLEALII